MTKPRHLLHAFSTFAVGGPEVRTCDLINHFGARYRHTIVAMDGRYECQTKLQAGTPVSFLAVQNYRQNLIRNVQQFSRILQQLKPDVLLTYNWGATEWGLANLLTRTSLHIHAEDGFSPDEMVTQKKRRIYARKLFLARAQKIVVPSRGLERMIQQIWKFAPGRVSYIPNGVDIERFSRIPVSGFATANSSPPAKLRVGTVATLRVEKNIPRLIRAFTKVTTQVDTPAAQLVIVGSGPEEETIKKIIQAENLFDKVLLIGAKADPAEVIKTFDIFAISSDTEQMPISLLEGMAASCPVVGTEVGDIKDMVAPSNHPFITPPYDENAYAQNLSRLLMDASLRVRLGQDNFARCRAFFDKSIMFRRYEKLYDGQS